MYTSQLTAMTAEAATRRGSCLGVSTLATQPQGALIATSAATMKTNDHTILCERISSAPAGSSNGQKSGNSPHRMYAVTPAARAFLGDFVCEGTD